MKLTVLSYLIYSLVLAAMVAFAGGARDARRRRLLALTLGCFVLSGAAVTSAAPLHLPDPGVWNWTGKAVSILCMWSLVLFLPALKPARVYATWEQKEGSALPAILMVCVLCVVQIAMQVAFHNTETLSRETLAYQATMPGLDEELVFRALLLGMIDFLCPGRVRVMGAALGWGALFSSVAFGFIHALFVVKGYTIHFDWVGFVISFGFGLGFAWIAERARSILWSIVAHNAINVAGVLVRALMLR